MHRLYFALFLTSASAALALFIGAIEALSQLATVLPTWLVDGETLPGASFWDATRWLNDHLELLGLLSVVAFLVAITCAVVLAPLCTPSQRQMAEEQQAKLKQSMDNYLRKGDFIVRFE
jgi:high-affinity nickel permease